MSWIEPKTDWVATDYFNATDYNRIIGNLNHLRALAEELYLYAEKTDLGADKDYTGLLHAEEINAIETCLEQINANTFPLLIGDTKTYLPNGKTIDYVELNRIESATLLIYQTLNTQQANLPRLAFALGGQKGIRV